MSDKIIIECRSVTGKDIVIDEIDADKFDGIVYLSTNRYYYLKRSDGTQILVSKLIYNFDKNSILIQDDKADFRRESCKVMSLSDARRFTPPRGKSKYKGVISKNDKHHCRYNLTRDDIIYLAAKDFDHAGSLYNAMADYIGKDGYRNDVYKTELNQDQKNEIDRRKKLVWEI